MLTLFGLYCKSRPYGNCLILTGILDIFQPITACIVKPLKNSTLHWHIKLKLDYYIYPDITEKIKNMKVAIVANLRLRKSIGRTEIVIS